jgi:peptidoglycan-associated lipoprotein
MPFSSPSSPSLRWIPAAAVAVLGLGAGCSHPQKVAAAPPAARAKMAAAVPVAKAAAPVAMAARPADTGKSKEDDAIYFDFDSAVVRDDARPVLQEVASTVRDRGRLRVEGNCDELGTVEYNLALGEHRARATKDYLVHLGVPSEHIATVSYGSQRPRYPGHDDGAHARNRRADLVR